MAAGGGSAGCTTPPCTAPPAGWTGFNCLHPMKRYCTHRFREFGFEVPRIEANLSAGLSPAGVHTYQFTRSHCAGRQRVEGRTCLCGFVSGSHLQPSMSASLALLLLSGEPLSVLAIYSSPHAGYCDEDTAACFCPSNTTYGRIPAPLDAPQGRSALIWLLTASPCPCPALLPHPAA